MLFSTSFVQKLGLEILSAIFEVVLIFVTYPKRLQSYLDPFVIRIALTFGPRRDHISHKLTLVKPRLKSYMGPIKTYIAVIFGP